MLSNIDRFKVDLDRVTKHGKKIRDQFLQRKEGEIFDGENPVLEVSYQAWYTESLALVRQLVPDRLVEFRAMYEGNPKRKSIVATTYTISDWMLGTRSSEAVNGAKFFADHTVVYFRLCTQVDIVSSASARFQSMLFDIRAIAQADLFDNELDAADELKSKGFLRAAGVVAGVVLEGHLKGICETRSIRLKTNATLSDINDGLKGAGVYDVPTWRSIQHLTDLRNLCAHTKDREPTKTEVQELIAGVRKDTKTLS